MFTMGRPKGKPKRKRNYGIAIPLLEGLEKRAEESRRPVTAELELALERHLFHVNGILLHGLVSAGLPLPSTETTDRLVFSDLFKGDDLMAFRVRGDSMAEAHICEDDYVIVRRNPEPEEGRIVVVSIDGKAVLKIVRRTRGVVWLHSRDGKAPVKLDALADSFIVGVIAGVVRRY